MKYYIKALFLTTYILLFTSFIGCGGGDSEKSIIDNKCDIIVTKTFAGIAVDGYIKDAKICLDINNDSICGQYEPSTITDENGNYSFSTSKMDKIRPDTKIILQGGTDIATDQKFNGFLKTSLVANSDKKYLISPLTTLVAQLSSTNSEDD
ncbi:MAG: hypothetical protein KAJ49_00160, partial [Arcobacteraceae bacterium]|nr:hypothetical protein [Arcobacteraceae bacterium]